MKKKYAGAVLAMGMFLALALEGCGGTEAAEDAGSGGNEGNVQKEETSGNEESGENIFGEFEAQTLDGEDVTQEIFWPVKAYHDQYLGNLLWPLYPGDAGSGRDKPLLRQRGISDDRPD